MSGAGTSTSCRTASGGPSRNDIGKRRVLFLCTGNSARSQMAEGLLRHMASAAFDVESAGSAPVGLSSFAVRAMAERGIDITGHRSKAAPEFLGQTFEYVVTVCDNARERCPIFPGTVYRLHWPFDDPAAVEGTTEEQLVAFRRVRDQIEAKISEFLEERAAAV